MEIEHKNIAAQQQRIDPEHPPAGHVEPPPVRPEVLQVARAALRIDWRFAVARRLRRVAEIVVAGQEAQRQAERVVQQPRRREIAFVRCAVEGDVSGVHHQIGLAGAQRLADAHEVVDEERLGLAEMGVGDLRDPEGHASTLGSLCCRTLTQR